MKLLQSICLVVHFLTLQNEAFAIIHKNTDNIFSSQKTALMKKPTLLQRYIVKKIGIKRDTINTSNKITEQSKSDSLAKTGLINIVAGISSIALLIISALISSETILFGILAFLAFMGFIALLGGFVQCLIALTKNNITPKGKKNAKTGLLLFAALVLLYVILWLVL